MVVSILLHMPSIFYHQPLSGSLQSDVDDECPVPKMTQRGTIQQMK